MRSKFLLSVLAITALTFSLGCGGGGGGGGSATPTTYTVSGSVSVPAGVNDAWAGSVRGDANLTSLGLTVQAFGEDGTSISEAQSVGNDGSFSFSVSPDADVCLQAKNEKGFNFRYHIGYFAANKPGIVVNASSTARAFLNWRKDWVADLSDTDDSLKTIVASITAALSGTTTGNLTDVLEAVATQVRTALNSYATAYANIVASNTALKTALTAANTDASQLTAAYTYFSNDLHSTISGISISKTDFMAATSDRYNRYNVTNYSFEPKEIRFTSPTTASVTVSLYISVSPKPGNTEGLTGSYGPVTWVIGWRQENSVWKIWQDFPYLKSQFNFSNK